MLVTCTKNTKMKPSIFMKIFAIFGMVKAETETTTDTSNLMHDSPAKQKSRFGLNRNNRNPFTLQNNSYQLLVHGLPRVP